MNEDGGDVTRPARGGKAETVPLERALDRLAGTIATALSVPVAVIVFDAAVPGGVGIAALAGDAWVAANPHIDYSRLADPRVAGELGLSFYVGVPLHSGGGSRIGTLAVLDRVEHAISDDDLSLLRQFAAAAEASMADTPRG